MERGELNNSSQKHRHQSVYNIVGSTEMVWRAEAWRAEEQSSKGPELIE